MSHYKPYQIILLLIPFVFSFALGLDIYIPIVPQMTQIFETSPAMIQLTLSLFLFVTGAGQLVIGPLSDQFGRKAIFYSASICFMLGSLWCAFSGHIIALILARVLASIGACGMLVTSLALVRDMYSGDQSARMFSFLNGGIGISPTFAPILGGYLAVYVHWKSVFFFLALIGGVSFFITTFFIQETLPKEKRVPVNGDILKRYLSIFSNRQFLIYSLIAGFAESVFFCFFSLSPFIIIDLHGIPTDEFGYYFAVFGSVIGLGGFASGKLIDKIGVHRTLFVGMFLMLVGGISMLIWHHLDVSSLSGFLIPMALACTGAMFLIGGSAALAMEPFGEIAGTAAAAFGAVEFGLSAIVGSLLMLFPTTTPVPYGFFILVLAAMSMSLPYWRESKT